MGKESKISAEGVFFLILAAVGTIVMILSHKYGVGTLRRPGPGLYPLFIGLAILIFSVLLLISGFRSPSHPALFEPGSLKPFLFMSIVFCLWILLMPILGYVPVTLGVTFAVCKIMKLEGLWKPLSISAGTAFFIYFLFDYWLYIDLPKGILG